MNDFETRWFSILLRSVEKIRRKFRSVRLVVVVRRCVFEKGIVQKKHEKKKVKRVNEFSFATKRWPHVESRRHAPLRAACSTRAPFRGAATRKNVNEEEEKMGYEERRRSESVTCLDLSIDRFGNFSRGKTFETNARFLYRRID